MPAGRRVGRHRVAARRPRGQRVRPARAARRTRTREGIAVHRGHDRHRARTCVGPRQSRRHRRQRTGRGARAGGDDRCQGTALESSREEARRCGARSRARRRIVAVDHGTAADLRQRRPARGRAGVLREARAAIRGALMATAIVSQSVTMEQGGAHSESGALMGRAAVLIWNDVAPEGRVQFYEWHDREHMPERLSLPGFLRGRRYARAGHSPEWLTIYEAVDVSALVSPAYLARLNAPTVATTR